MLSNYPNRNECKIYESIQIDAEKYQKVQIKDKVYDSGTRICNTKDGKPITTYCEISAWELILSFLNPMQWFNTNFPDFPELNGKFICTLCAEKVKCQI